MDFSGKVAIVTGAGSGIGAATAWEFATSGAHVVVLDIHEGRAKETTEALTAAGHSAETLVQDVADQTGCRENIAVVAERLGRIDVLVNNAVSFIAKGLDVTTDDWNHVLGVNVRGYANMVQACHPAMERRGGGAVVNLASISAHVGQPDRWTYNATKGAIVALTKCMALDLAPAGIRVNTVSPGWIWTPEVEKAADGDRERWEPVWGRFHMLRRLGQAAEVARAIAFLCSDAASFITAAELPVDGGYLGLGSEGLGDQSSFAGSE